MKQSGLNVIGFLAFLITLALVGGSFFLVRQDFSMGSWEWTGEGDLQDQGTEQFEESIDEVEISTVAGPITVELWDKPYMELTWEKWGSEEVKEKLRIETSLRGSHLSVRVDHPRGMTGVRGWASLSLKIPGNLKDLKASSISGSVKVLGPAEDLSGIDQELRTTSGSVLTEGAGNLAISSISGSLRFRAAGERVDGSSTSGSIRGTILGTESDRITLSSVSGSVTLGLPENWGGRIVMRSVSGSLRSALPLVLESQERNRLTGTLGSGGGEAELKTTSGSVRLEKGEVL